MEAKSFHPELARPIRYSLVENNQQQRQSTSFRIESDTGIVRLSKPLDADDPGESSIYYLKVIATEGNMESTATLNIRVLDVNDHGLYFSEKLMTTTVQNICFQIRSSVNHCIRGQSKKTIRLVNR